MKKVIILNICLVFVLALLPAETTKGQDMSLSGTLVYDISFVNKNVNFDILESVDNIGNLYIRYHSQLPSVKTFVNKDGTVTVCTSDDKKKITYIYEYSMLLKETKTLSFNNELGSLGAFTKDDDGNYYFFYGEKTSRRNDVNMAVLKYNKDGKKMNQYKLEAFALNSFNGIKIPFQAGTCRLEISGSMLAVYFAREKFNGHQSSYGFILDKYNFERIDNGQITNKGMRISDKNTIPYVSHSFNQFVLPINNGFLYADHGDAYPRAFCFSKFIYGGNTQQLEAFKFPGAIGLNNTTAEMGGIAKTSTGYIFVGAYGLMKESNPRNLFILTFDEMLSGCSNPVYLTKYTKNDGHVGHPKIVALDTNRFLVLWEKFKFSTQASDIITSERTEYLSTHILIINEKGEAVSNVAELEGVRLNMNDVPRYNPHNGKVYWAINDSEKSIKVFALEIK